MQSMLTRRHLLPVFHRPSRIISHARKTNFNHTNSTVRLSSTGKNNISRKSRSRFAAASSKCSQSRNKSFLSKRRNYRTGTRSTTSISTNLNNVVGSEGASACTSTTTTTTTLSLRDAIRNLREPFRSTLLKSRTVSIPRWISPRPFSFNYSELFGHGSFVLVAISYAMDDHLALRVTAVAGSTSMLFFTYFHPHGRVLWLPFRWNVMFIALNVYRIGNALLEDHLAGLMSADMSAFKERHLTLMEKKDFAKLLRIAEVEWYEKDDVVVRQGETNHHVRIIVEGDVDVFRDGIKTYALTDGNFVTEAGLHAGLEIVHGVESCCTITAASGRVRCLKWNRTALVELCRSDKHLYRSLQFSSSWDIVRKLKAQRKFLIEHRVDDPELWTIKRTEQSDSRYESILRNILEHNGHLDNHRNEIAKYRSIHQIDDEHHERALRNCGWTREEYAMGRKKEGANGDDDGRRSEDYHGVVDWPDWQWYASLLRTFRPNM